MIHVKDHKQVDMFTPFERLGPKRLALLESSWAHLFREEILHKLPAEKLFHLYDDLRGRPTKELYAMLGIVLLQQMEDLTDEEAVHQFAFNIMWRYALNVTDSSDFNSHVAPRTLWTMRDHVGRLGLDQTLFEDVTEALRKLFDLDPSKQRLDSVHIFSNMAHLGRIRLFVKTIRKFLVNLKRHHAELYQALGDVAIRYEEKNDGQFAVKPNKEVPSDSLQNPSDPDAGYCGHKGKGYQVQVMETYSPDKSQPWGARRRGSAWPISPSPMPMK